MKFQSSQIHRSIVNYIPAERRILSSDTSDSPPAKINLISRHDRPAKNCFFSTDSRQHTPPGHSCNEIYRPTNSFSETLDAKIRFSSAGRNAYKPASRVEPDARAWNSNVISFLYRTDIHRRIVNIK